MIPVFTRVTSCRELELRCAVEVRREGTVLFAGQVTDLMPDLELFWAVSGLGERRIVTLDEGDIYRLVPPPSG